MPVNAYTVVKDVAPDITRAAFVGWLAARRSPALSVGGAVYDYCAQRGLSAAFLLGMFWEESSAGTNQRAICVAPPTPTHSWGNTTDPSYGAEGTGDPPVRGRFTVYADWYDGGISTVARLFDHRPYHGQRTIRDLLYIWAPPTDNNDTERYIRGVVATMNALGATTGDAVGGGVPEPPIDRRYRSPNKGYQNGFSHDPQAVTWHITEGSNSLGWLMSPASGASSNYLLRRDGHIYELVPPEESAWANGDVNQPDLTNRLIRTWVAERVNFNQRTVSIECEGYSSYWEGGSLITPQQVDALVDLTAWLCAAQAVQPDRTTIIRHQQINDVDRHNCPGFSVEEMDGWIARVQVLVQGGGGDVEGAVKEPPAGQVTSYVNHQGETIAVVNFGGTATRVEGTAWVDVGTTVVNAADEKYARSLKEGVMHDWQAVQE